MIGSIEQASIAGRRQAVADTINDFSDCVHAYVQGAGALVAVDEARAVATAAAGRYMLDLAELIDADRADDAATMRAMAALLATRTRISPFQVAQQTGLAERLARLA
ncbi:hypothetical protein [Nonomuraea recticatena]|uniref:Uncharacterized protein n=1 Tax=Nonomuraea recticatena TaxID=46178 RepID=A0ABN3RPC1_9ACTN